MANNPILVIFLYSLMASLGTGIGGLLAVIRRPGRRSYGFLMGMTAGVMIALSFLNLVSHAWRLSGPWVTTFGFGTGAVFMLILDYWLPHIRFREKEVRLTKAQKVLIQDECGCADPQTPSSLPIEEPVPTKVPVDHKLIATGLLLAVGISLHNLPEGIAVGAGYLHDPQFGLFIAMAIMLHNIPEGLATALPLCKGGYCRWKAVLIAFLSGLAEPVGALIASLFLVRYQGLVPFALAFAGGVMTFITLDELIPTARDFGSEHYVAVGIIIGSLAVLIMSGLFGL